MNILSDMLNFRRNNERQLGMDEVVYEIIRTLGRLPSTPLIAAYQKVIFAEAESLYPFAQFKTSTWMTPEIEGASLDHAPSLASRINELRNWLKHHPQFVFSLLVGLTQGEGEERAWAIAYG